MAAYGVCLRLMSRKLKRVAVIRGRDRRHHHHLPPNIIVSTDNGSKKLDTNCCRWELAVAAVMRKLPSLVSMALRFQALVCTGFRCKSYFTCTYCMAMQTAQLRLFLLSSFFLVAFCERVCLLAAGYHVLIFCRPTPAIFPIVP